MPKITIEDNEGIKGEFELIVPPKTDLSKINGYGILMENINNGTFIVIEEIRKKLIKKEYVEEVKKEQRSTDIQTPEFVKQEFRNNCLKEVTAKFADGILYKFNTVKMLLSLPEVNDFLLKHYGEEEMKNKLKLINEEANEFTYKLGMNSKYMDSKSLTTQQVETETKKAKRFIMNYDIKGTYETIHEMFFVIVINSDLKNISIPKYLIDATLTGKNIKGMQRSMNFGEENI